MIMEVCLDNREADIGRFVRRHLSGVAPDELRAAIQELAITAVPDPTAEELTHSGLEAGFERFNALRSRPGLVFGPSRRDTEWAFAQLELRYCAIAGRRARA